MVSLLAGVRLGGRSGGQYGDAVSCVCYRVQGDDRWCRCSLVFGSEAALVVSTVTLRWRPAGQLLTSGQCRFSTSWSVLRLPWHRIHPRAALVRHTGALVAR